MEIFFHYKVVQTTRYSSNKLVHERTRYSSYQLVHKEPDIYKAYLITMICFHGTHKSVKAKYEHSLHIARQQGHYQKKLHIEQILMKVDFSLILLLALGAVIDLHVEL
jgi:hypothetical protein